ncbi:MAG: asparaginase [Ekhidna sp.]
MKYKIVNINKTGERSVLIIYTGGTFGMVQDSSGALAPFNFGKVVDRVPELRQLGIRITVISFPKPIDSSNILVQDWKDMAYIIEENYSQYDAFVILHGTDTMAYSASMLSYMLEGLNKPVIFTGAQMPIGSIRSDARENLITALEIAAAHNNGDPIVSEVCVYFNYRLLRGSRSQKLRSSTFAAFESENYPWLAEAGIEIEFNYPALKPYDKEAKLIVRNEMDSNVAILKIFPGITEHVVRSILSDPDIKGVVIETFGSGNTMSFDWFIKCLQDAIDDGKVILNVSQCIGGEVEQGRYETSKKLNQIGVLSGGDITTEAAITKLIFLLGAGFSSNELKQQLTHSLVGEMDSSIE